MRKLLGLMILALATCCQQPLPAQESTSLEPSVLHLTQGEIASMLGSEEQYSGSEIATWLVGVLQPEVREEIRATAEQAAAVTARPLLVDIAGLRAERAVLVRQRNVSRCIAGVAAIVAVVAVVWGIAH